MKQRVISAVVALIICVPIILYGSVPFTIGASIIGLIGFMEFLSLRCKKRAIPYIMKITSVLCFVFLMMGDLNLGSFYIFDSDNIIALIILLLIPIVFFNKSKKYNIDDALFLLGSVIFLGIGFNMLINIRLTNLYYLLFLLSITIFTDTFAYIVGMLIGKNKMCPSVSPKKTWEGFIGGLVFGTFISTCFYVTAFDYTGNMLKLIFIIICLSVIGQLGDLVFSSIKRSYDVKDYGNIMPGHGGVLDRLDSLIFVVFAFSYLVRFI